MKSFSEPIVERTAKQQVMLESGSVDYYARLYAKFETAFFSRRYIKNATFR